MASGIYAIRNLVNGKVYIGRAVDLKYRKRKHFEHLARGKHHSIKLQHAYSKYGRTAFLFETVVLCAQADLAFFEQRLIDGYNSYHDGYNCCPNAIAPMAGRKNTPESNEKRAMAMRGRPKSPEAIAKMVATMTGLRHSPDRVAKNKTAQRKIAAETSVRMLGNKNGLGTRYTDEQKAIYSACWTPERRSAQALLTKARFGTPKKREAHTKRMRGNTFAARKK